MTGKVLFDDIVGRVPIIFGITGHRDIVDDDVTRVKEHVKGLLLNYRSRFPQTPIIFVSPLAEGVDQIAAAAALEIEGVRLAAILPMPQKEYVKDFLLPKHRVSFRQLLAKASWIHVTGFDLSNRDKLYRDCGRKVASIAHILIVAWNRFDNKKLGGAADTVKFKLQGCIDYSSPRLNDEEKYLSRNETGLVLDIPIRRRSEPSIDPGEKAHWLYATGQSGDLNFDSKLDELDFPDDAVSLLIDQFNSEGATSLAQSNSSYTSLLFCRADLLAQHYQAYSRGVIRSLFASAIFVALLNPFNRDGHSTQSIMLEVFAIFIMWALWYYGHKKRLKDRYEDYRSLAEAARVQFAWQRSGIKAQVADSYLSAQTGDLDWLRRAVRSLHAVDLWSGHIRGKPSRQDLQKVIDEWLAGQFNYYHGASTKNGGKILQLAKDAIRLEKYTKIFLAAGIAILGISRISSLKDYLPVDLYVSFGLYFFEGLDWAPYLATLSLALAASLKAYGEVMGFGPVSRRYQSMAVVLGRSIEAFTHIEREVRSSSLTEVQNLFLVVGLEALAENGEWIITHRQKDIKPPA